MTPKVPRHIVIEDERAAYAARYHNILPEGNQLREIVLKAYGGQCVCCGHDSIDELTIDHIVPVKGGARKKFTQLWREGFPKDNLQVLCVACNNLKGSSNSCLCPHSIIARHFTYYAGLVLQAVV